MKKSISLFSILLLVSLFSISCGDSGKKPTKVQDDEADTEAVDTDTETDTDTEDETDSNCGNKSIEEGEVCDGGATECAEIDPAYTGGYATCKADCSGWDTTACTGSPENTDPADSDSSDTAPSDTDPDPADSDTGDTGPTDADSVFVTGPYQVNTIDVASGSNGSPRDFRIYEPSGAQGSIPVIHFLHGFIVVSSQSDHGMIGGDTTIAEAEKVVTFINWLKQNIQANVSVTADIDNFGVSGHSRGGKVTNRVLNTDPSIATSFFGVDPVDSAPPMGGSSDPNSLKDPVQFAGESMFLGTEKGPDGFQACAPSGENSVNFYAGYPSVSHHIIAAGVGHADMVDPDDVSACGMYCSACAKSGDTALNQQFIAYAGGLMAAFFNSTLKGEAHYEEIINDSSLHPFATTLNEHK